MRASAFLTIAVVLFAASLAQASVQEPTHNVISRNLLQDQQPQQQQECTGTILEKAKCVAENAANTVATGATNAANAVANGATNAYNSVVGNDKNATATNTTTPAEVIAANGTTPASGAIATSGLAIAAAAAVFALAY